MLRRPAARQPRAQAAACDVRTDRLAARACRRAALAAAAGPARAATSHRHPLACGDRCAARGGHYSAGRLAHVTGVLGAARGPALLWPAPWRGRLHRVGVVGCSRRAGGDRPLRGPRGAGGHHRAQPPLHAGLRAGTMAHAHSRWPRRRMYGAELDRIGPQPRVARAARWLATWRAHAAWRMQTAPPERVEHKVDAHVRAL